MIGNRPSGSRFVNASLKKPTQLSSTPAVVENSVDLALSNRYGGEEDIRVAYYKKRGIGTVVGIPGAGGMGSGISHIVYRVPKSQLLTRNEVRKIYKNEEDAMMAAQSAERAAAAVVRQGEMNANAAGIVYSNEPISKIDIDGPIHIGSLVNKALQIAAKKKWNSSGNEYHIRSTGLLKNGTRQVSYSKGRGGNVKTITMRPGYSAEEEIALEELKPSGEEGIQALRNKFIEMERQKKWESAIKEAHNRMPKNRNGKIMREYWGSEPQERERIIQEHVERKLPKIEAVLAKLREGMIMGFAPPAPKVVPKEENLLRFNNLSSINFSAPAGSAAAGSGAPPQVDPFEGLGGKRKTRRRKQSKKTRKIKRN
jgi:hypothetical protein